MAQRLPGAGFPAADITVIGPNDRKGNMVARYRGKSKSNKRPVLIIGHLDVVEARREDWTTDPCQFVEPDGDYYGRGTQDMKDSDAIAVAALITQASLSAVETPGEGPVPTKPRLSQRQVIVNNVVGVVPDRRIGQHPLTMTAGIP